MDLMVHGDVKYKHHHGHEAGSDWAAKVKVAKEDGKYKLSQYHILVVSILYAMYSVPAADCSRTPRRTYERLYDCMKLDSTAA